MYATIINQIPAINQIPINKIKLDSTISNLSGLLQLCCNILQVSATTIALDSFNVSIEIRNYYIERTEIYHCKGHCSHDVLSTDVIICRYEKLRGKVNDIGSFTSKRLATLPNF